MPRIVRCGLIQASNAMPPTDKQTALEAIKSAMIEKHIPIIEEAGKRACRSSACRRCSTARTSAPSRIRKLVRR